MKNDPRSKDFQKRLFDALMDTTISSAGKTIFIQCGSHDSKDFLLDFLTCTEVVRRLRSSADNLQVEIEAHSSMVEHQPLTLGVEGSSPSAPANLSSSDAEIDGEIDTLPPRMRDADEFRAGRRR